MRLRLRQRSALGLIMLGGVALRLYRLGADSLWYDETVSTALAGSPLPELIRHTAGDIHPPGYYALLRGWLLLAGYPTGQADLHGSGLEFAAGFFSLFFGVVLIALIYALARRLTGRAAALTAVALAAFSPYNVWYSQEVRMYTLGAALGAVVVYALLRITQSMRQTADDKRQPAGWWAVYAVAAAAGMYTLYYFAFLLIPLNLWLLWQMASCRWQTAQRTTPDASSIQHLTAGGRAWLLANVLAALLYAPWIPVAYRQASAPPVPPWRDAPDLPAALHESWNALSLGQSAPAWLWPALLLTLGLSVLGMLRSNRQGLNRVTPPIAAIATLAPLALILVVSLRTPLYHVRYLFTYSPTFYVMLAAGLAWLWRRSGIAFSIAALAWLAAAGVTLHAFWADPLFRADDHRAAVRALQDRWRPGDVLLVNAGWAYTALTTYWDGPIAGRSRLADDLPAPRSDAALVIVTTGHVDGRPDLGWADPRSDFFALPAGVAQEHIAALFRRFDRVWHYRIYDTVNDPAGRIRAWLAEDGLPFEDRVFAGEAFMRVQGFLPRRAQEAGQGRPEVAFASGLIVRTGPLPTQAASGETLYPALAWQPMAPQADFATSLRLVGPDGAIWAQGPDERPSGPDYPASRWPAGATVAQTVALPVPPGTPPGAYSMELVVYDPATGQPWPVQGGALAATPSGVRLGEVTVTRPDPPPALRPALARFGPLTLIEAATPATAVAPGGQIPLELLWQANAAPAEHLVVIVQLQDAAGIMVAGLEEEPVAGRYPTRAWQPGELVRDRHTLSVPAALTAGSYRLIIGVYRATDRQRLTTRHGLFGERDYWIVKGVEVR